jgi:two-component system response regulator FixJ
LTPRLREVLRLVADGILSKGIALRLKISIETAEFQHAKLMKKLGARGIAGLVRYAIRMADSASPFHAANGLPRNLTRVPLGELLVAVERRFP